MSHVLVVDDSATIRNVIRGSLTMAGMPEELIEEAQDGQEALEAIRANRPHLVISDVNMPRMTGLELLQTLRQSPETQDLPVVIVTSVSNSRQLLEVVRQGARKVIRKPFDPMALPEELEALLPQMDAPPPPMPEVEVEVGLEHEAVSMPQEEQVDVDPVDLVAEHLPDAVSALMERMLFATAESREDAINDRLLVGARIDVHEAPLSAITVLLPLEMAHPLAERVLGQDVDPKDEITVFDCVGELANMLIGELLHRMDSEDSAAHFGIPKRIALPPASLDNGERWSFDIDQAEHVMMVEVCR